jgi:hypothetical protein
MTDRVHGFSSPQDFARVVASAGHEDGWVAAGQSGYFVGCCDLCEARTQVKDAGNGFMAICDPCDERVAREASLREAPEFDLLALAHRLSLEWKALTEASDQTSDPLQGLLRCIARDVNAAVMLAFTAAEVRRLVGDR